MSQPVGPQSPLSWRVLEESSQPDDHHGPLAAPTSEPEGGSTASGLVAELVARPTVLAGAGLLAAGILVLAAFLLAEGTTPGIVEVGSVGRDGEGAGLSSPVVGTSSVVVEVAGAVVNPGVYTLPNGARVGEAISAAGGYGPRVDAARADLELNLAEVIRDGDRIRVPSRDDPLASSVPFGALGGGAGSSGLTGSLVNLNRADSTELESLPGIGPATAAKIIAARQDRPFASVDELLERKLVSSRVLESIRNLVTVR